MRAAWQLVPVAAFLGLCLVTFATLHPSVFWSPDEGGRFLQMAGWRMDDGLSYHVPYPGRRIDPVYVFYPHLHLYPRPPLQGPVRFNWPTAFSLLSLLLYRGFGIRGIYAIPLLAGVATVALTGILAERVQRRAGIPAMLLAGCGTPLLFYSVLFWDHTLTTALAMASAVFFAVAGGSGLSVRRVTVAAAGTLCLLAAGLLREELFIFALALVLAAAGRWLADTHSSPAAWLRRGVCTAAGLLLVLAGVLFRPGLCAVDTGLVARTLAQVGDPAFWSALPEHASGVLVNNPIRLGASLPPVWLRVGGAGLALAFVSRFVAWPWRLPAWSAGSLAVAAAALVLILSPERFRALHGLFLVAPCILTALLKGPPDAKPRLVRLQWTCICFLALYVAITHLLGRRTGGLEWGSRYALVAYPLCCATGAATLTGLLRGKAPRWLRRLTVTTVAVLLMVACQFTVRGAIELQATKRDLKALESLVRGAGVPVVTDMIWLAGALAPTFIEQEIYTLRRKDNLPQWLAVAGPTTRRFVYVSYTQLEEGVVATGTWTAHPVRQMLVQGMRVVEFRVRP